MATALSITYIAKRNQERKEAESRKKIEEIAKSIPIIPGSAIKGMLAEQVRRMEKELINSVIAESHATDNEKVEKIREQIKEFNERIAKIESKFPDDSKIEKISSINDAIFSERIDQLQKTVQRLEEKQLSRWDVALVVSMIVGAILTIVAATYGVLSWVTTNA